MRVNILQTDITWNDIDSNILKAEKLINDSLEGDLYILPEMWSTGFATEPQGIADEHNKSLEWMLTTSNRLNAVIAGSVSIVTEGEKYFNRFYFAYPNGKYAYYDKRHLFSYGGENNNYIAGKKRVIVTWKGIRFLLLTCYDLRFPVWSRNKNDYDGIILVSNWPSSRKKVFDALLTARAIENQCFVIGVNRVGQDLQCTYHGGSKIIDAKGNIIAGGNNIETECVISGDINTDSLNEFRNKFKVLADADIFEIIDNRNE